MIRYFLLLSIGVLGSSIVSAQNDFEIRYLGNMGIAVSHHDSTILIDGLHDFYENEYLPTDTVAIAAMLRKQKPFSKILAIAVTHRHSDHFDPKVVASVVNVHSTAVVIGGSQTAALLYAETKKNFRQVVEVATFAIGSNLTIHARRVPHTYPERHAAVENYRIEIIWNGFRLIHLGDAHTKDVVVAALNAAPDVMVIPAWYLSEAGVPLIEKIRPVKVIATHIAPGDKVIKKYDKLHSDQVFFKNYGDKINISKQ